MTKTRPVAIVTYLILMVRALAMPTASHVQYCRLIADAQGYDGKTVVTAAIVLPGEHSLALCDPLCKPTQEQPLTTEPIFPDSVKATKLGRRLVKILSHRHSAQADLEGTFHSTG